MSATNPLRDEALLKAMLEMRASDPDAFMNMVLSALKTNPEYAVEDAAPVGAKLKALESLIQHFEGLENYEDCAFILNLKEKINNGSKE